MRVLLCFLENCFFLSTILNHFFFRVSIGSQKLGYHIAKFIQLVVRPEIRAVKTVAVSVCTYLRKITDKTEIESGSKSKDGRTMIPLYAENKKRTIHWATKKYFC